MAMYRSIGIAKSCERGRERESLEIIVVVVFSLVKELTINLRITLIFFEAFMCISL